MKVWIHICACVYKDPDTKVCLHLDEERKANVWI